MVEVNKKPTNVKTIVDLIMMIFFNSIQGYESNYTLKELITIYETLVRNSKFTENLSEEECEELLRLVKITASGRNQEKIEYYKKLVDDNNIIAMYLLGDMYLYGVGNEQNITQALEMFKRVLCHEKCSQATYIVRKVIRVITNIRYCYNCEREATFDSDSQDIDTILGRDYIKNRKTSGDISGNIRKGIDHLIEAAKRKDYGACYLLGCTHLLLYNYGIGIDRAIESLEVAGNHGILNAYFELGNIYSRSPRIRHDYKLAEQYYEKAAVLGNGYAQFALGNLYSSDFFDEKSYIKSIGMYIKVSRKGLIDPKALIKKLSLSEDDVEFKFNEIIDCIINEYSEFNPQRLALLGRLYLRGKYVECDYEKARLYLEKAAGESEFSAMCDLGYMYLMGLGVESNIDLANTYFDAANKLLSEGKRK